MESGLIAIIITIGIIAGAIKTRRCVECMLAGSFVAAIFAYGTHCVSSWCVSLQEMLAENVWVFLVCLLFGALIKQLTASRGSFGFSKYLGRLCSTERRTHLATFAMGIVIFVDDYLNILSIGACMKRIYDKRKLPREALAYVIDSTGAPVCVLIPISTWAVFYANLFYDQESVRSLGTATAFGAYIKAIPFCFYPIITLIIVFLFCMGWFPKLGPMKDAYRRVAETGKVYSDHSNRYNREDAEDEEGDDGNIWYFIIPMTVLVALALITGDILSAVVVALAVCFGIYIPRHVMSLDDFMNNSIEGFADMLPVLTMLLITFVLKDICADMGMTEYIITRSERFLIPAVFPAMVFFLGAFLAFTTGSDWGMSSVITPIAFPLGSAISANPILIMAAIISGGTFGSHACFYSDATLLAAQSSGIDNMEHGLSQLPYALIGGVISVICFMIAGLVM